MREKGRSFRRALPWAALMAAYVVSLVFYGLYGSHNLDADISSEMVLANLLNQEGNLTTLSDSWFYSTELRIVSPVPLYQMGLRLFSSWHAAHTFAVALILLMIALSTVFMAREAGFGESGPWLAAVLMLPFSRIYAYIVIYGGFYSMHLVCSFMLLGLICRCARRGFSRSVGELLLIALLSLVGGLGGVRMLTMFIVPVFGAAILIALSELRLLPTFSEGAHKPEVRMAGGSALSLLFATVGYLYNSGVLSQRYRFATYDSLNMRRIEIAEYLVHIRRVLEDLGLRSAVPFFSEKGFSSLAVIAYLVVMCLSLRRLASHGEERMAQQRLFVLTGVIAVGLGMTLVILLDQTLSRYYIVGTLMLFAMPFFAWEIQVCNNGVLRTGVFALLAAFFLFQSSLVMRFDYTQGEANYEMTADWLLEHGYTQGYATFWYANTLTEASDGQIEMWSFRYQQAGEWTDMELHETLQRADHNVRDPEGRVFLLVDQAENSQDTPLLDEAHLVDFVAWSFYIYEYDSVDEMRALIAGAQ